ncbi:MAG: BrnT family toxin [Pyrinomonadaceae bacterium]
MKINEIIWLQQFAEKIERRHHVSEEEVDEVLAKQPPVRRMGRGARRGEDLYRALGQTESGRYLSIFFIYKSRGRALVISARDADAKEIRHYGTQKR